MSIFYSQDRNKKLWQEVGLKDFANYGKKITRKNLCCYKECDEGEWFYADDECLTIYHGTYTIYYQGTCPKCAEWTGICRKCRGPGNGFTVATVYDDREEYSQAVDRWKSYPFFVPFIDDDEEVY